MAGLAQLQRTVGNQAVSSLIVQLARTVQRKDKYSYGSANTTHIHVYGGGAHLKIVDRGRVRRYNLVVDGRRHNQADDALAAAAGNPALVTAINDTIADLT